MTPVLSIEEAETRMKFFQKRGIRTAKDLSHQKRETLEQLCNALKIPISKVCNPFVVALPVEGSTIPNLVGALKRLIELLEKDKLQKPSRVKVEQTVEITAYGAVKSTVHNILFHQEGGLHIFTHQEIVEILTKVFNELQMKISEQGAKG